MNLKIKNLLYSYTKCRQLMSKEFHWERYTATLWYYIAPMFWGKIFCHYVVVYDLGVCSTKSSNGTFYYSLIPYSPLHQIELYYTILYYTILYYTILYYTILYYTIIYYTILYYTILYYTILYYTMLYYTIQYNAIL